MQLETTRKQSRKSVYVSVDKIRST